MTTAQPSSVLRDLAGGGVDVGKIGVTVAAARRRADGDQCRLSAGHRLGEIGGEREPACGEVCANELGEARLVDWNDTLLQGFDLPSVLVDANNVMTEIRKAGPGYEAHVPGTDHRNAHAANSPPGGPVPAK